MELTDAITYLRSALDQAHKIWGYYQVITSAAIAFAWASTKPPVEILIGLAMVYLLFSVLNCRLIYCSQVAALEIWNSIQNYQDAKKTVPAHFLPILKLNKPDSLRRVVGMHFAISLCAIVVILVRIKYVGCA